MGQEVETLIKLLEDNDSEVLNAVSNEILRKGTGVISELERAWETANNESLQERLENLIYGIQYQSSKDRLLDWVSNGAINLLEGAVYVSQFQYPNIDLESMDRVISDISKDIYLTNGNGLTAIEKVKLLNYVVFELNNFNRNTSNFYSPQNLFINQVLETRRGNPISLGIIYLSIARKLELPIYGVNLPKSFVLAYMDEYRHYQSEDSSNDVLFYINPYNKGAILNRREVDFFLKQQNLEPRQEYFSPCSNESIIIRLLTNLIIAYQKLGLDDKIKMLQDILAIVAKDFKQK